MTMSRSDRRTNSETDLTL